MVETVPILVEKNVNSQPLPNLPAYSDRFKKPIEVIMAKPLQEEFSMLDIKVFNVLLATAYTALAHKPIHRMQLRQLVDILAQWQPTTLPDIMSSLNRLIHGEIAITVRDEKNVQSLIKCHYLSIQHSIHANGWLDFAFDQILLRFLASPKIFGVIDLPVILQIKSKAGGKLYELMATKYYLFHRSHEMTLEEAYEFFEVKEDSPLRKRPERFRDAVEAATKEVNGSAPFQVSVEYLKFGRGGRIIGLTFNLLQKPAERLAVTTSLPKRGRPRLRDERTVDMFSGNSDAEVSDPTLKHHTMLAAQDLVGTDADIPALFETWKGEYRGTGYSGNPQEQFLAWLRLTSIDKPVVVATPPDVDEIFLFLANGSKK